MAPETQAAHKIAAGRIPFHVRRLEVLASADWQGKVVRVPPLEVAREVAHARQNKDVALGRPVDGVDVLALHEFCGIIIVVGRCVALTDA